MRSFSTVGKSVADLVGAVEEVGADVAGAEEEGRSVVLAACTGGGMPGACQNVRDACAEAELVRRLRTARMAEKENKAGSGPSLLLLRGSCERRTLSSLVVLVSQQL